MVRQVWWRRRGTVRFTRGLLGDTVMRNRTVAIAYHDMAGQGGRFGRHRPNVQVMDIRYTRDLSECIGNLVPVHLSGYMFTSGMM